MYVCKTFHVACGVGRLAGAWHIWLGSVALQGLEAEHGGFLDVLGSWMWTCVGSWHVAMAVRIFGAGHGWGAAGTLHALFPILGTHTCPNLWPACTVSHTSPNHTIRVASTLETCNPRRELFAVQRGRWSGSLRAAPASPAHGTADMAPSAPTAAKMSQHP